MDKLNLMLLYGRVKLLEDPETELNNVTAIALPYGNKGYKVCFVKFNYIGPDSILNLTPYVGQRHLSMTQIVKCRGKWCSAASNRRIYILRDVTRRIGILTNEQELTANFNDAAKIEIT